MQLTLHVRIPKSPSTQTLVLEIPLFAPRVGKVYWKHLTCFRIISFHLFLFSPGLLFVSFFLGFRWILSQAPIPIVGASIGVAGFYY